MVFDPEYQELVRHIRGIASNLTDILSPYKPKESTASTTVPSLELLIPQDFFSFLPASLVEHRNFQLMKRLEDSQRTFFDSYKRTCQRLALISPPGSRSHSQSLNSVRELYQKTYQEHHLPALRTDIECALFRASHRGTRARKTPFNSEYTPLLEKYFEYNAYPSQKDKEMLARKTMMDIRQIDVWFQNHRRRGRKEGRSLRRLSCDPLPIVIPLESLERKMPMLTIPEPQRTVEPELEVNFLADESVATPLPKPVHTIDRLTPPAPSHAFPTPFPPICSYDPFPCKSGKLTFPPPIWPRKPASPRISGTPTIDMEEFIVNFATKLHIRGAISRQSNTPQPSQTSAAPWFATRITTPSPAPHPSLISNLSSPASLMNGQTPPSPFLPPSNCRRKPPSLPRRIPGPKFCGGQDLLTTFATLPSVSRISSRSSSLSSVCSSDGYTASSSSPSSSNVTTPSSSPTFFHQTKDLPPLYPFDSIHLQSILGTSPSKEKETGRPFTHSDGLVDLCPMAIFQIPMH